MAQPNQVPEGKLPTLLDNTTGRAVFDAHQGLRYGVTRRRPRRAPQTATHRGRVRFLRHLDTETSLRYTRER